MRLFVSHDEEDEIRAICTDCQKTTILQIRQRYVDDITIVRINAMWNGYDDFDDYFSESYEDDYWNMSPTEDEEDSNISVESSPVQHSFGDINESLEYLDIGDAEVHGPPSLITPNDNNQSDLISRLNIVDVQSTIPSIVENDDNTSSPYLVPIVTPTFDLRRSSMSHATTQTPLTEEPEGSDNTSFTSLSSPENRRMDNDPSTIYPGHDDEGMEQHERMQASRLIHSSTVRRKPSSGSVQPIRDPKLQATLAAEIEINGVKAFTLFDSGSTTDSLTPEFAFATRAKQITLEDQVILQLGCVGSRSKICYGTKVPINICGIKDEIYFNLVNLDRHDCIIGTPFMNVHGVCLDFGNRSILINGQRLAALTLDEEQLFLQNRKETVHSKKQSRLPPRETKPITKKKVDPGSSRLDN